MLFLLLSFIISGQSLTFTLYWYDNTVCTGAPANTITNINNASCFQTYFPIGSSSRILSNNTNILTVYDYAASTACLGSLTTTYVTVDACTIISSKSFKISIDKWNVQYVYSGSGCTGSPVAIVAAVTNICTPASCSNIPNFLLSQQVICPTDFGLNNITNGLGYIASYTSPTCQNTPNSFKAGQSDICLPGTTIGTSVKYSCNTSGIIAEFYSDNTCTTRTSTGLSQTGCNTGNLASCTPIITGNTCFHHTTIITYNNIRYTMDNFLGGKVKDCVIPHVIESIGMTITISYKNVKSEEQTMYLMLTPEHLVWSNTNNGFTKAGYLTIGDTVIINGDGDKNNIGTIKNLAMHNTPGKYFGLNCINSQVFANDIYVSTFGYTHAIPSLWMKYIGQYYGIQQASKWGDTIVNYLFRQKYFP